MELKDGMWVTPPNKNIASCLTFGKKYQVSKIKKEYISEYSFFILSDHGNEIFCLFINCVFLKDQSWVITTPPEEENFLKEVLSNNEYSDTEKIHLLKEKYL